MIGYNKNEIIGKMRERVILQNRIISQSDSGFQAETFSNIASLWSALDYKTGFEEEDADKIVSQQKINFTLRYNENITTDSRFIYRNNIYQVEKIDISNDRRFVFCTAFYRSSYAGLYSLSVNLNANVNATATTSANLKLIMSVIGQANAIASAIGDLTVFQQGLVEVAASVNALGTVSANVTKVISISGDLAGSAFVDANASIVQNISASVQTDANISANLKLSKTLISSVNASATATSILDVVTQGIVSLDTSVTATGTTTANLLRIATLESSSSTASDTSAIATLTKVLEASATATANTDANAQLTIPVNASATATAETSANAQLTYTVNAEATATAESLAEAQIVRIISASATAMAESSAEASFGVTFAANVEGTANVENATIARAATMVGSVTGEANVTGATLTTVENVAASVNATATVTNATLDVAVPDPNFANVSLLLHGNGANGSTMFTDNSPNAFTVTGVGNSQISTARFKFPTGSILFDGSGDYLTIPTNTAFNFGSGAYTLEAWIYLTSFDSAEGNIFSTGSSLNSLSFNVSPNGALSISRYGVGFLIQGNAGDVTLNTWTHVAVSRVSTAANQTRLFVNGILKKTGTDSITHINAPAPIVGGFSNLTTYDIIGNIDDLRITKGVARYTANFTPPTSQFPDQ